MRFLVSFLQCLIITLLLLPLTATADFIGLDFGPGETPPNWNSITRTGQYSQLKDNRGVPTSASLTVLHAGTPYSVTPMASTLPRSVTSLAAIDGNLYEFGGTFKAVLSGLVPGAVYDFYLFGLRSGASLQQDVQVIGTNNLSFTQQAGDGVLAINNQSGSASSDLQSYAKTVKASQSGTLEVTVIGRGEAGSPFVIAGLALDQRNAISGAQQRPADAPALATVSTDTSTTHKQVNTPTQARQSSGIDVVGLELGMTREELLAAIRRHNPRLNLMEHSSEIIIRDSYKKPFKAGAYIAEVQAFWDPRAKGYQGTDARQSISAVFAGPPNAHQVESILRDVRYVDSSTYPDFDSLVAALIGKYGQPDFSERKSQMTQMVWQLDGQSLSDQHLGRLGGTALNPNNNHSTRYHLFPVIDASLPANVLSISDDGVTIRHGNKQYIEGGRFLAIQIVQQGAGVNFMRTVLQDSMMKIGKARGATAEMARVELARHEQQEKQAVQQRRGPDI